MGCLRWRSCLRANGTLVDVGAWRSAPLAASSPKGGCGAAMSGGSRRWRLQNRAGWECLLIEVTRPPDGLPAARGRDISSPAAQLTRSSNSPISLDNEIEWFLPYLFIHPDHRGEGLAPILVQAAVELARSGGASAIESWPLARSVGRSGMPSLAESKSSKIWASRARTSPVRNG